MVRIQRKCGDPGTEAGETLRKVTLVLLWFGFECFVKIQELLGAEFFGADGCGPIQKFNCALDFLFIVGASEGIGERLAFLRECGADKVKESVGGLNRIFAWSE